MNSRGRRYHDLHRNGPAGLPGVLRLDGWPMRSRQRFAETSRVPAHDLGGRCGFADTFIVGWTFTSYFLPGVTGASLSKWHEERRLSR